MIEDRLKQFNRYGSKTQQLAKKVYITNDATIEEQNEFLKLVYTSLLLRLKRNIRRYLKHQEVIWDSLRIIRRNKAYYSKLGNILQVADLEIKEKEMHYELDEVEENLAEAGKMLYELLPVYEFVSTDREFASLINVPYKYIQECREVYEKSNNDFYITAIFVNKAEAWDDEWYDKPLQEPFWEAMYALLCHEYEHNKEIKQKMNDKMDELFPDIRKNAYRAVYDMEGNIVELKKAEN
jgi:hypothetical protein